MSLEVPAARMVSVGKAVLLTKKGCWSVSIQETNLMHDSLQSYLKQKAASRPALTINYHIGDSFSGETDLRLSGDGAYEIWSTATEGRQRRTYSGTVDVSLVEQLIERLLEAEIWNAKHVFAKPGEDDPLALIAVEIGDQRFENVLWVSEIRHSPPFAQAQQALLSFIRELSSGEVLEGGQ